MLHSHLPIAPFTPFRTFCDVCRFGGAGCCISSSKRFRFISAELFMSGQSVGKECSVAFVTWGQFRFEMFPSAGITASINDWCMGL